MITPAYAQRMARYNRWQNENLYGCADRLPDSERKRHMGAFFGSIHGTLCHLVFGDQVWMHRFDPAIPAPKATSIAESTSAIADWAELKQARGALDAQIIGWCDALEASWIAGNLTWYSGAMQRDVTAAKWMLLAHMFNHQTHHRGQVHCMLTQSGIKPGDTDMPFMDM
jgi:uncharacterized damage-inducible protein DinB